MSTLALTGVLTDASGTSYKFSGTLDQVAQVPPVVTAPVKTPPVENPSGASIPLSSDDARFANNSNASSTRVPDGGALTNKSITDTGVTASIVTGNGATIQNCRVNSREAVRIGGGGSFLIDGCYLEATGSGDDHADVIQTYSPGSRGTLAIRNTAIVSHNTAATAGLFVADNWTGTIDLENVVVWGGPYGVRIHPDVGGDNIIRFKNVFVVGPFMYDGIWVDDRSFGGHKNIIDLWENVREATIVNGQIVLGDLIPQPF